MNGDASHHLPARRPAAVIALVLLVAGCASTGAPSSTHAGASRPLETVAPAPSTVVGEVPDEILDAILADAAERSGAELADLDVLTAEGVAWPDGSLGCPELGGVYTQAIVDGYQVILYADGTQLDYRVGEGGGFRLCEAGDRPTES
jgi:hypothetical protein